MEISWTAGFGAKLHHMYFGDNFADVNDGTAGTYKGPTGFSKYTPGTLEFAKTYYWRVDEFGAIETHKGNVWSFTTRKLGTGQARWGIVSLCAGHIS